MNNKYLNMKEIIKKMNLLMVILFGLLLASCNSNTKKKAIVETDENGYALLTDEQVENIVRRSYQYVAMYNVNNKFAASPKTNFTTGGWNKGLTNTELLDHTVNAIARPNNDNLYQAAMLDLQHDAVVFKFPAINSKYVSLMITGYDHYVNIPLSTIYGDFDKPTTMLIYSSRTKGYEGEPVEGIDHIFEATCDFVSVVMRVMPHAVEQERYDQIVEQINAIEGMSLSEYKGGEAIRTPEVNFPAIGETDADIFENNLLEVMQFVFNHTTFDENNAMDRAVLAAYEELGIMPGHNFDSNTAVKINGKKFRTMADKIKEESLALMLDPSMMELLGPKMFQPKGKTDLKTIVALSVIGPIGQPMDQAMYRPVNVADGSVMNAQNDYVIRMTKEEMPPALAFWSVTLYDQKNGFFIPNDYKKYSVGENAGFKLNEEGGIEIHVAAERPAGVPLENWLPVNREDQNLDVILRIYAPDLEKMKTWKAPVAEKIN